MITNPRIKKIFLLIILIISCTTTFCQNVGIGTNTPAASAQLDISSTTKGLLTPRMTTVERDAIVSPATGLLIYNTTEGDFNFFNGTAWDKYLKDLDYLEYGLENTTLLNLFNPYEYGQTMTWVVPDGVKQILVNMKGGKGGKATRGALTGNGGDGSSVSAILNVIPGQTIVFSAGSRGADYNNGNLAGNVTTIGGGGGGSSGGTLGTISYGGGGGASKITIDGTVVLVAAGGGGGYVNSTTGLTADGGCGTFPVGCNGGSTASGTSYPGGGGTQTQGGINSFDAALNGTAFQGNARGGGGGYYGGAGGEAAGSGGGSSWSAAGASFGTASYSNGYRGGTINIKYDAHKITTDIVDANEGRFGPLVGLNSQYVLQTSGKSNFNGVVSINDNLGIKEQSPDFPLTFETTLGDKISLYGNTAEAAHYGFGVQSALLQIHSSAINDDIAFGYGSSNSFTERMRIKGNGNVGIGTTSPNAPLQFPDTTVSRKIVLWETANNDNQFSGFGVNGNVVRYQSDNANADHVFYSAIDADNSKELVRIKGSGNVGIGNTNPAVKLHITGDEYIDGSLRIRNNATTNNYGKIEHSGAGGNFHLDTYGTGGMYLNYFSGNGVLIGNGASGITATFSTNGNLGTAGTLTQNSDARLKKNIEPLTSSLRNLLQLNGYTYNWVDAGKDDKQQIGIIAQEVEKMFPSLVTTNVDGYKSVNYIGLIPVMIESIKEQQSQIDALKKENEDIKKDNIEIKKMINKLLY